MAETAIEWTATRLPDGTALPGYTFNPWEGCQKVGPGCDNCYAEARNIRFTGGENWGPHAPRRLTSAANWRKPIKWNKQAAASGIRRNVFCASLADVMDTHATILPGWRIELGQMILATPHLNWLLLTKRIGNAPAILKQMFPDGTPPNVWLGITVVNQTEADRDIPKLLATKAQFGITVAFLSMEPLLGPVDLTSLPYGLPIGNAPTFQDALVGKLWMPEGTVSWPTPSGATHKGRTYVDLCHGIDWVIVGGESGPNARPMHPDWARSILHQCEAAGVAGFFKQWGEWVPVTTDNDDSGVVTHEAGCGHLAAFEQSDRFQVTTAYQHEFWRIGKSRAGRMLDGREWNSMPGVA